jgi:type III pantothenate kinase
MILCLDVGNSQIFGGVYQDSELIFTFRKTSTAGATADEYGLFLKSVLRENGLEPNDIKEIAFCSVVPDLIYSLKNACQRYFKLVPFILRPGVKTGLKIKYKNPAEVGSDRIATAIAASSKHSDKDLIIIDFGTATTFCAVTKDKKYLGGSIAPGLKISMQVLEKRTAKLPTVEIERPEHSCGRSTVESIQAGLYYGHLGMVKELISRMTTECFKGKKPYIVGTGGLSTLFRKENLFDEVVSDLVLTGIYQALKLNEESSRER